MQDQEKAPSRNLTDIAGAPFIFSLKDGTQLGLDDWTLASESWAKAKYGSMEKFNTIIFRQIIKEGATEEDMDAAVAASIATAAHQLDEDSYRIVSQRLKEGQTTEEFLASHMRMSDFKDLCHAIVDMITASMPEGYIEDAKKKAQLRVQPKKQTRR